MLTLDEKLLLLKKYRSRLQKAETNCDIAVGALVHLWGEHQVGKVHRDTVDRSLNAVQECYRVVSLYRRALQELREGE